MPFLDTQRGKEALNEYLSRFEGGSRRVYESEIRQLFSFKPLNLSDVNKELLHEYQEKLSNDHSPKTAKRKFSILNGFFKYLEASAIQTNKGNAFKNPIETLKEFKTDSGSKSEEFQSYINHFLDSQNTKNTRRAYENLTGSFFAWLNKDLKELTGDDLHAYRDYLRGKGYKETTIWNKFIAINRFFKYVEKVNRKFKNPVIFKELKLLFPKRDKGYYTVLSQKEAEKLLKQPDKQTDIGKRDLAILYLMLVYGLRANEVTGLKYGNLEKERVKNQQKVWIVDRKGRFQNRPKTAIILSGKSLKAFDLWSEAVRREVRIKEETPLFLPFIYDCSSKDLVIKRDTLHKPISTRQVENIVNKYIKNADLSNNGKTLSAHALRHTAFTMLAQAGVAIQDIKSLAGHQDINTTMIYIHSVQSYDDHPGLHNPLNK